MRITTSLQLKKSKMKKDGKCPVYARCIMNGSRIEISTSVYVSPNEWDRNREAILGKDESVKILNNRLNKFTSKLYDIYNQLEATGEEFDIYTFKEKIVGKRSQYYFLDIFDKIVSSIEKKINRGYSIGTLKHYKTTQKRLTDFVSSQYFKKDIPINKVDYTFLNSFDIYLKSVVQVGPNTVWGYHRHLKKVLNDAIAMECILRNPYDNFKVKRGEANRDFLTMDELRQIENKSIMIKRLDIVRDVFVFACYTGLSYSDLCQLRYEHLNLGNDGEKWIIIDREKTKSRCRIPLLPRASSLIKKYENFPVNNSQGLLLPVNSNQKMNAYLKELAAICGINKKLSMHVARHTFATSVTLANGVPIETVSKMLGHNSLKTTQIYARIVDKKISEDMKKLKAIL